MGVEHQLLSRVGLDVTYNRSWRGNTTITDNRLQAPSDFTEYCVTAPTDARIGSVSGTQICGLYDVNSNVSPLRDNLVTHTNGKDSVIYNGVDVVLTARFLRGGLLSGGGSFGNTVTDNCLNIVDSPNPNASLAVPAPGLPAKFCRTDNQVADVKVAVAYPLPWDVQASAAYQNLLAPAYNATQVYTAAQTTLGRSFSGGVSTATVTLLEPNKQREDRAQQLDLRFSKLVKMGRTRLRGRFDIYNVMNAADVLSQTQTLATNFRKPASILAGRTFKFGANVEF
jgi:hypothetical protein